jgi:hypothetical protein
MARHPDTRAVSCCLNHCLALLRQNAGTPFEEVGIFQTTGPVALMISHRDAPAWHAQIAEACEIPSLQHVSRKAMQNAILEAISELPEDAVRFSKDEADAFVRQLDGVVTEYTVHRPVWGLTCDATSTPLELGRVTLYNRDTHVPVSPVAAMAREASFAHAGTVPRVWASVTVKAHDETRAIESADEVFEQLEAVLNCLLPARGSEFQVSILSPNTSAIGPCQVDSSTGSHLALRAHGQVQSISIDEPWFRRPAVELVQLVELVGNRNANSSLQNDVLYAVQWCAKSLTTDDVTTAFIQAAVAMEVLLGSSDFGKGGISGRMAVSVAHLLGATVDEAEKIETHVSTCYRLRSQGVHGSDKQHADLRRELPLWQRTVSAVILKVLETGDAAGLKALDALARMLQARTYAYKDSGSNDAGPLTT